MTQVFYPTRALRRVLTLSDERDPAEAAARLRQLNLHGAAWQRAKHRQQRRGAKGRRR